MTDLPVIRAAELMPFQVRQLIDLLERDPLSDACTLSVEVQWKDGGYQSTRVTPETFQEIAELLK